MSYLVETEDGTWELPDNLAPLVTAFMQALEAAAGASAIKFHPSSNGGGMSEIVVPKITNVGLNEAKEKSEQPLPIRLPAMPMFEALKFQRALQEAGATVELPNALDRLARI